MNKTQGSNGAALLFVTHPPRFCIRIQSSPRTLSSLPHIEFFALLYSCIVFWKLFLSPCSLVIALFFARVWLIFRFIYETEHFNGVAELLEILGRLVSFV